MCLTELLALCRGEIVWLNARRSIVVESFITQRYVWDLWPFLFSAIWLKCQSQMSIYLGRDRENCSTEKISGKQRRLISERSKCTDTLLVYDVDILIHVHLIWIEISNVESRNHHTQIALLEHTYTHIVCVDDSGLEEMVPIRVLHDPGKQIHPQPTCI